MTMLMTPSGTPASRKTSISFTALMAPARAGLSTTVLPAIIAAAAGPVESAIGKLKGLMTANTPCGRSTERVWVAASPRLSMGFS